MQKKNNHSRWHRLLAPLLLAGLLLAPGTASATLSSAKSAAATVFQRLRNLGVSVRDTYVHGFLARGDKDVWTSQFYRGTTYYLVGAGCRDAYDVDLLVYDENYNLIDRDSMSDAVPIVTFTPKWTGQYHVVVKMYNSTSNGAHWILQTGYTN